MAADPTGFEALLQEGAAITYGDDPHTISRHDVGVLVMPTGSVWAGDPLTAATYRTRPFTVGVDPGRYRIVAVMADNAARGPSWQVPAALQLVVRDEAVATWEPAQWPGLKPTNVEDVLNGYPVDSGTGCFADVTAGFDLATTEDDTVGETIQIQLHGKSWTMFELDTETKANVAVMTTGGDGVFGTWVGRTTTGEVACFLTSFGVVGTREG
ncbi:DUF4241 domain-containing protein [Micromonospora sp. NPDC051925]|uniref:DUF4241 domain-containing protein n=1 Tax=Micromonospora sp. NPDC051925 TaxID=3364288 RepID=UPI0037C86526